MDEKTELIDKKSGPTDKKTESIDKKSGSIDKKSEPIEKNSEPTDKKTGSNDENPRSIDENIDSGIGNPKYENLVLSGGSIKSISQVGAIKKLIDEKLLDLSKLKSLAGTSAGSLIGLLIVLGFNIDEIWNFIYYLDMGNMVKPDILLFLRKCGVETGQIIYNLIEEILTKKTGTKHINFRQLYEITNIHFIVVGSCLTTKEAVYYDHVNTPNFKVSMAIRISISIPGFFIPIIIDNKKYVDGGLLNNYPMNLFEDRMEETIGILNCNEYNTDYRYPEEYFMAIMNLFMYNYYEKTSRQYANNTIYINKSIDGISMISFNLDYQAKIDLFNCGVEAVEEFIKRK
jgi:predicted acylesterase/phospholipase RssA